ncbi:uncharacterized protein LOC134031858 [Osmerus eperlanus]|uniref:uncharacterized protein LOC134031858 n=1 Tax=Osmerus eperlanus TaxID=29151 RepID=UPI002E14BCB8
MCLQRERSTNLERELAETKTRTETEMVRVKASLVATIKDHAVNKLALEDRLSKALQAFSQAEGALALSQTSMTAMEAHMESVTGNLRGLLTMREEESKVLVDKKTQALEAQGRAEESLTQAQASLLGMKQGSLKAEKSWLGLMVEKMEAINAFDTESLHALCLQWQVSSDKALEVKDRDWRRKVEDMDIQMSQLEEEKKQAQTDLHLALAHIQTINAVCVGRFLVKKAWKKMERKMQKKS